MNETLEWKRYPLVFQEPLAKAWLLMQEKFGRAPNTIDAYGRSLEDYLAFYKVEGISFDKVTKEHIANYVNSLIKKPNPKGKPNNFLNNGIGLANATMHLRLTVVRLFYDYVMDEGIRVNNPVGRGRYTNQNRFGGLRERGLIPKYRKLPWIPTDDEWRTLLNTAKEEPLRNRVMLAFAYDGALRREELCSLTDKDIDPAYRLLTIKAENTKNRQARVVPYSPSTDILFNAYLQERRALSRTRGPLFLSESRRNRACPISFWTWSKVIERIAKRSGIAQFTTHTLRHLRLTDLARADWDIHEIALFAGHRNPQTTLMYLHLSGHDLKEKIEKGMAGIHKWRSQMMEDILL